MPRLHLIDNQARQAPAAMQPSQYDAQCGIPTELLRGHVQQLAGRRVLQQAGHVHHRRRTSGNRGGSCWSDKTDIGWDHLKKLPHAAQAKSKTTLQPLSSRL